MHAASLTLPSHAPTTSARRLTTVQAARPNTSKSVVRQLSSVLLPLLLSATLAGPLTPPADAALPASNGVKNARALLRNALPIDDIKGSKPIRDVQRNLEAVAEVLRVPGSKTVKRVIPLVNKAEKTLTKEEKNIMGGLAADKKEAGLAAIEGLKASLKEFDAILAKEDKQKIPIIQQECLYYVSTIEESMVSGFPFTVPAEYSKFPQLKGRAEIEMKVKLQAPDQEGLTDGTFKIIVDGYNAPISAGNFVDLVDKKFYDGMKVNRADGFVVQYGDPDGPADGYEENGETRRIPFEVRPNIDKEPVYEVTLEDIGRSNDLPALPFNAFGTLAVARAEFDANSGSSQMFFLLKESELTPTGSNLLDGRYAVFGYIVEGQDFLTSMKVNDKIVSAKVTSGLENLTRP